jgi:hypothetical protein
VPLEGEVVEFRSYVAPRIGLDRNGRLRGLALVKARRNARKEMHCLAVRAFHLRKCATILLFGHWRKTQSPFAACTFTTAPGASVRSALTIGAGR